MPIVAGAGVQLGFSSELYHSIQVIGLLQWRVFKNSIVQNSVSADFQRMLLKPSVRGLSPPPNFVWGRSNRAQQDSGGGRFTEANQVSSARPPPAAVGLSASAATFPQLRRGR